MKTILIGLDAFDPLTFERLLDQGRMPNLAKHAGAGNYAHFSVSNPAQSEVSWTSIATGLNPGGHGMFDFVHRDPASYALHVSMLPTQRGLGGVQFVPPYTARTLFDQAVRKGFPATALWWPAAFPVRPESPVEVIPGLGTPDIHGQLGVGTLFLSGEAQLDGSRSAYEKRKTRTGALSRGAKGRYTGLLKGPTRQKRQGAQETALEFYLDISEADKASLTLGKQSIELVKGRWSPILEVTIKVGLLFKVHAITRFILTQTEPEVRLYTLPLQIHPLHSPWRYASPPGFVKRIWEQDGPFLTVGWPQDTTGLEEGCISDEQFLDLCETIFATRERILMSQLDGFREGVLASVFDSLDRIQHMFWRDRPDVVESWYEKLDAMVGRVEQKLANPRLADAHLMIVSDHGFTHFDHKVHLNRWLLDKGYLALRDPQGESSLQNVDWQRSQAYAIGLNSLYLNQAGREGQGIVNAGQAEGVLGKISDELLAWQGPGGKAVVQQAWTRGEALEGPLADYGPDLLVGFSPGYRGSSQTGLGGWEDSSIEANRDHWGADHCINPNAVPGVLFSNQGLKDLPNPSYHDIPWLAVGEKPDSTGSALPPKSSEEDQAIIEERLKSLGYL